MKTCFVLLCFCFLFRTEVSFSQKTLPFQSGEELSYDVSYKYGIVMVKAGHARFKMNETTYGDQPAIQSILDFKTNSFFDKIIKVRDTLSSYVNSDLQPVYHLRSVNEGGTRFLEHLFFFKQSLEQTDVRIKRESGEKIKIDTIMSFEGLGYDLLNIFLFTRTLDYEDLQIDRPISLVTFVGKDKVKINVRYKGQSIIEKSDILKYKAVRFEADIVDEVFSGEKNAMEIWISDDDNRIPLKLKAKLKIGTAEAMLTSYKNLRYPFTSEIKIPH